MLYIARVFHEIVNGMRMEFELFGFKFSCWGLMFYLATAEIVIYIIRRILDE